MEFEASLVLLMRHELKLLSKILTCTNNMFPLLEERDGKSIRKLIAKVKHTGERRDAPHDNNNNDDKSKKTMTERRVLEVDATKAGMQGADKKQVNKVINDMSRGSKFYDNELRKNDLRGKRIAKLLRLSQEFDALSNKKRHDLEVAVEKQLAAIVASFQNDASAKNSVFVHIDMDYFFAAVAEREDPSLRAVPFAVGGMSMLSTSNYEARKYGVRAGMPGYIAKQLCPQLVIKPYHPMIGAATQQVRAVAARYDPNFVSHGGDELCMCLDFEQERQRVDPVEHPLVGSKIAAEVRQKIFEESRLTASAGIGPTRALAKIASNLNKPNGQHALACRTADEIQEHVHKTIDNIRIIGGIGKVQSMMLERLGIVSCRDLFENRVRLSHCLLPKTFSFLLACSVGLMGYSRAGANGEEEEEEEGTHSVGCERTFYLQPKRKQPKFLQLETEPGRGKKADDEDSPDLVEGRKVADKVFRSAMSRLEEAIQSHGVLRLYQVVVKAKKTTFEVHSASNNVANMVLRRKTEEQQKEEEEEEEKEEDNDGDENSNSHQQQQPDDCLNDGSEPQKNKIVRNHVFPLSDRGEGDSVNEHHHHHDGDTGDDENDDLSNLTSDGKNSGGSNSAVSEEDRQVLRDKFEALCLQVGYAATPAQFRLLGCRFAFNPGVHLPSSKSSSAAAHQQQSGAGIRQRTLDEYFGPSKSVKPPNSAAATAAAAGRQHTTKIAGAAVAGLSSKTCATIIDCDVGARTNNRKEVFSVDDDHLEDVYDDDDDDVELVELDYEDRDDVDDDEGADDGDSNDEDVIVLMIPERKKKKEVIDLSSCSQ